MKLNIRPVPAVASLIAVWVFITATFFFVGACASKPPTALERKFYDVATNYGPPQIVVTTNVIPVTVFKTNEQNVIVPVTTYQTNLASVTNIPEGYVLTPNANARAVQATGVGVGNIFGVGGIAGTALGALFSLWGYVRSNKRYVTAGNLAQGIETIRAFIKTLPNGAIYDSALTTWLQQHQADAGTVKDVLTILEKTVSNSDAQIAAQQIRDAITVLNASALPPVAKV